MTSIATLSNATEVDAMRIATSTNAAERAVQKTRLGGRAPSMGKIDEAAQEFEAQFISQMLENMFSAVDTKGFLGGGEGEEIYRSMMINEYGKLISRTGGIGVVDHVKSEMLRMQEAQHENA